MDDKLLEIIKKNKSILVISENNCGKELYQKIIEAKLGISFYINILENHSIENLSQEEKYVFLFDQFGEDGRFENIYMRYRLDSFDAKIVVICRFSLINHYRDPSLYFVPIKNGRLQKKSFIKYEVPISDKDNLTPVQPLLKKEAFQKYETKSIKLRNHYLNQKLMTHDVAMMQGLADRVQESEEYRAFLFKLIYATRDDETICIAAANAITALNYAKISFSLMDLSSVRIVNADLSNSICHETKFVNADLHNTKFINACLENADFKNANLSGIDFGKIPNIFEDCAITRIIISGNKKIIAASDVKGYMKVYNTETLSKIAALENEKTYFYENNILYFNINFDGTRVITLSSDGYLRVWDVIKNTIIRKYYYAEKVQFDRNNQIICLSYDGKYSAIYSIKEGSIKIWDNTTGENIISHENLSVSNTHYDQIWHYTDIKFSPDNLMIYCLYKTEIASYQIEYKKLINKTPHSLYRPCCFDISIDNEWFVIGYEHYFQVRNKEGKLYFQSPNITSNIESVQFLPGCEYLVVFIDYEIYFLEIKTKKLFSVCYKFPIRYGVVNNKNIIFFLSRKNENSIFLEKLNTENHRNNIVLNQSSFEHSQNNDQKKLIYYKVRHNKEFSSIQLKDMFFSNDYSHIVLKKSNEIHIFCDYGNNYLGKYSAPPKGDSYLRGFDIFKFSSNKKFIINFDSSDFASEMHLYDMVSRKIVFHTNALGGEYFNCFSPSGNSIIYSDARRQVMIKRLNDISAPFLLEKNSIYMFYYNFIDEDIVFTVNDPGHIKIWNILYGELLYEIKLSDVNRLKQNETIICHGYDLSKNNKLLAIYYTIVKNLEPRNIERIAIIDCEKGELFLSPLNDKKYASIVKVKFSNSGNFLLVSTARPNSRIEVFSVMTGNLSQTLACFSLNPAIWCITDKKMYVKHTSDNIQYEFLIEDDYNFHAILIRTSNLNMFNVKNLNIENVKALSDINKMILEQEGAINRLEKLNHSKVETLQTNNDTNKCSVM